jgi:putative tryptophan/tyrosine transport system substrate-binding protein
MEHCGSRPSRREFVLGAGVAGLGLVAGCGRLSLPGQQAAKVPRIGFLGAGSREGRAPLIAGLHQGLREYGYVEGQNLLIEYRFSENRDEQLPALAAELVALKVDLIVISGTPASFAAKEATNTIPLVMGGLAANPIETGLVTSLAHPGSNVTGMSMMTSQLSGKRLELLKESLPGLVRVAVFWNPPNPAYRPILRELEKAADILGLDLLRLEVRVAEDLAGAFEAATRQQAGALIVPADPLTTDRQSLIADLALQHRLPTMMDYKEFVYVGGLLSMGVNLADLYRRSAHHVDKILKGANPADLPMQQPIQFDIGLNLKTAQALGITFPNEILLQVTEVIQ